MKKFLTIAALATTALLSACGGGGGSPGSTNLPYSISVRSAKTILPINITNIRPNIINYSGIGVNAPYTTTVYVDARAGDAPIVGKDDKTFACAITDGLDFGSLYYLDGNKDHEDPDGNPMAYRSIVLGSNSGGASFHFNAGSKAGVVRITCSVTNPADNQTVSASTLITVGAATGKPASVVAKFEATALGTPTNTSNLRIATAVQGYVWDDANQPIPDPVDANLQVTIRPFGASAGAYLLAGAQRGSTVQVRTINGMGLFTLGSGPAEGIILVEMTSDRADNNVANGIQEAVTQLKVVTVHQAMDDPLNPLENTAADFSVANGKPYTFVLSAKGGTAPYTWTSSALPAGLTLSADGIISGMPMAPAGDYKVSVTVTDVKGVAKTKNITITVTGELTIDGCKLATVCALPDGTVGAGYSYTMSLSYGDPTVPVVWTLAAGTLPPTLTLNPNGTISGTTTTAGSYVFSITATRGTLVITQRMSIKVEP